MVLTPEVLWAQRSDEHEAEKNLVFLTVNVPDVPKPKIELEPTKLTYSGTSGSGKEYFLELEFFDEIDVENSKYHSSGRDSHFILRKKEAKQEYWPRLTKESKKVHYIKTDFDKWVDEDEQDSAVIADDAMGGFGGGGMPDMSALGAGGMDFSSLQSQLGGSFGGLDGSSGPSSFGMNDDSDEGEDDTAEPEEEGEKSAE